MECKDHMSHDLFGSMSLPENYSRYNIPRIFHTVSKKNHDEIISFRITTIWQTICLLQNCCHTKWK